MVIKKYILILFKNKGTLQGTHVLVPVAVVHRYNRKHRKVLLDFVVHANIPVLRDVFFLKIK